MKVALFLVVVLGAYALYAHQETSGKMSATALSKILHDTSLATGTLNPIYESCKPDPQRTWDYLCTDNPGQVEGYNVNQMQVTNSGLVRDKYGNLVHPGGH
jgi:hypothetical protein